MRAMSVGADPGRFVEGNMSIDPRNRFVAALSRALAEPEAGHAKPIPATLVGAAGAVLLGIGAANDTGWLAVVGGIALGVGLLGALVTHHIGVEYEFYQRLDALEKKNK
jgi:hypothetical protein